MMMIINMITLKMMIVLKTSFELSHPESILPGRHNVGEGGHVIELSIPGHHDHHHDHHHHQSHDHH